MNAFTRQVGAEGASLVGHSLAGGLSVVMALEEPGLYSSLAVIAPAGMGRQIPLGLRLQALPPVGHALALITPLVFQALGPARLEGLMRRFVARDGDAEAVMPLLREAGATYRSRSAVRAYNEVLQETATLRGQRPEYQVAHRLRELSIPTLVVWGAVDKVLPISQGRRACGARGGPELRVLPGCGHVPQLEAPDTLLAILDEFLGRLSPESLSATAVAGT
jgi:pimeloyl-ACP methyl ester carboxylesterase